LPEAVRTKAVAMDGVVFQDYAARLLPRALGYSTALLDYFFRGRLEARVELAADGDGVHASLELYNRTAGEVMDGTFTLYADEPDGRRQAVPGAAWTMRLAPDQSSGPLSVPLAPDTALASWLVVFRGQLGTEGTAGEEPVTVALRVGSPVYLLQTSYWTETSAQGSLEEDSQRLTFLRPDQYT
jgi:hypothetical protein